MHYLDSDLADDPEVKRNFTVNAIVTKDISSPTHKLITHFSSWKSLKIAVGWILTLKMILLTLSQKRQQLITSNASGEGRQLTDVTLEMQKCKSFFGRQRLSEDDLLETETSSVRFSQWEIFQNVIVALASGKSKVKKERWQKSYTIKSKEKVLDYMHQFRSENGNLTSVGVTEERWGSRRWQIYPMRELFLISHHLQMLVWIILVQLMGREVVTS